MSKKGEGEGQRQRQRNEGVSGGAAFSRVALICTLTGSARDEGWPNAISIAQCGEFQYPDDPYGNDRLRVLALQDELVHAYRKGKLHGALERSPDGLGLNGERILTRACIARWWAEFYYDEEPGELIRCWLLSLPPEDPLFGVCNSEVREWLEKLGIQPATEEIREPSREVQQALEDMRLGEKVRVNQRSRSDTASEKRTSDLESRKPAVLELAARYRRENPGRPLSKAIRYARRGTTDPPAARTIRRWIDQAKADGDGRFI